MGTKSYILDGKIPVLCEDTRQWGRWIEEHNDERIVSKTNIEGLEVSTVFLGLDHRWGDGPPLLFETMIFDHRTDAAKGATLDYQERYTTWELAIEGHIAAVAWLLHCLESELRG